MSKIAVMSEHLSTLIAAGEVVDRPMNIVKECVENSMDAHAKTIEIEVFEGGISGLIITDDGDGMDPEDAELAFAHHATSKLKNEDDLFRIMTMGFRGEALASISAVSHVDLQTNDGTSGTHIVYDYGECSLKEEYSCPKGTRIEVRGLFVKTPARLKYLKKANYEFSVIADAVNKLALAHPEIRFVLKHDGRLIFQSSGNGSQREVLYQMYGRETAENAVEFFNEGYDFQISGLTVQPKINRASKNFIYITINGRVVRSWPVSKAVIEGYREFLPKDRYPITLINITVDPQLIDVNVHPNKMEVRLSKEEYLSQLIINTIENLFYDELETPQIAELEKTRPEAVQEKLNLHYSSYHEEQKKLNRKNEERRRKADEESRNEASAEKSFSSGFQKSPVPARAESAADQKREDRDSLLQMMNPNRQDTENLIGNPHFDSYQENSGKTNEQWARENLLSEQALRKEMREQFNGAIPVRRSSSSNEEEKKEAGSENQSSAEKGLLKSEMGAAAGFMDDLYEESPSENVFAAEADPNQLRLDLPGTEAAKALPDENPKNTAAIETFVPGEKIADEILNTEFRKGTDFFNHLTVIGQLRESYILCENPDGLVIIDQHAAQERCNFEKLQRQLLQPSQTVQPRMVPLMISVSSDLFTMIDQINEFTDPYGLHFEQFGSGKFILRQEPLWFLNVDKEAFIQDILSGFASEKNIDIAYMRRHMIATMACHSSIRFNRPLNRDEMEKVIWDLQECEHPYHCPHGRPTVLTLSDSFLRRGFERG